MSIVEPKKPTFITSYGRAITQTPLKNEHRYFAYFSFRQREVILSVQSAVDVTVLGRIIGAD